MASINLNNMISLQLFAIICSFIKQLLAITGNPSREAQSGPWGGVERSVYLTRHILASHISFCQEGWHRYLHFYMTFLHDIVLHGWQFVWVFIWKYSTAEGYFLPNAICSSNSSTVHFIGK